MCWAGDDMEMLQKIFEACTVILNTHINLMGYSISLMNVLAFGFIGFILLYLLFRLTK